MITYCFNPNCAKPENIHTATVCQNCGTPLLLQERYRAIKILEQSYQKRTFQVFDLHQSPPQVCVLKQTWQQQGERWKEAFNYANKELNYYVQISDYWQDHHYFYLVQDWLEGKNLIHFLAEQETVTIKHIWQLLADILPVLSKIHQQGWLHRNIKPTNIVYSAESRFILIDWDYLAPMQKIVDVAVGDPEYTAPEQLQGQAIPASDLYSLGVTCLYLLTGISPFNLFDSANNCWVWRSYWLGTNDSGDAERISKILDQLVALNINKRYQNAANVLQVMGINIASTVEPSLQPNLTGECQAILTGHQGLFAAVNAVAFSRNGNLLASASDDKTVRLWNWQKRECVQIFRGHEHFVKSVIFAPSSATLVSGSADGMINFWNLETKQLIYSLKAHSKTVNSLQFNANGSILASGSADKTIKLWNSKNYELITTLIGHRLGVTAVAFAPNRPLLASASQDRTVQIWDLDTYQSHLILTGHTWAVQAIAWSPDGSMLASGGDDNTILLWDVATGRKLRTFSGHSWAISSLAFVPTNTHGLLLISASWDYNLKLWQVATGQLLAILASHTDSIYALAVHPSLPGIIASSSKDQTVRLWKIDI